VRLGHDRRRRTCAKSLFNCGQGKPRTVRLRPWYKSLTTRSAAAPLENARWSFAENLCAAYAFRLFASPRSLETRVALHDEDYLVPHVDAGVVVIAAAGIRHAIPRETIPAPTSRCPTAERDEIGFDLETVVSPRGRCCQPVPLDRSQTMRFKYKRLVNRSSLTGSVVPSP